MSFDLHTPTAPFEAAPADQLTVDIPAGGDLDSLAATIDRIGIDGVLPGVLDRLAVSGRAVGVHPQVAALLTDPGAPDVVRRRAFGHVCRHLAATPGLVLDAGTRGPAGAPAAA